MTIVINGTTGISGVDGSAGTPAVQGTDTNTGVFYPAADTVGVSTGGSERMRVTAAGNVAIGTSSPNKSSSNLALTVNAALGQYPAIELSTGDTGRWYINADATNVYDTAMNNTNRTFYTGGSERMRIDSSGNVGIGTASPSELLTVTSSSTQVARFKSTSAANNNALVLETSGSASSINIWMTNSSTNTSSYIRGDSYLSFATNGTNSGGRDSPTERMRIDSSGNLLFNSGYGSVATAYGCRAWVNFNGTGTVAIRASGNVTSITDNGVGDYTLNFTNALPDANYSLVGTVQFDTTGNEASHNLMGLEIKCVATPLTTTSARVAGKYSGSTATYDMNTVAVAIFR